MCAISFLENNMIDEACDLLKKLVLAAYNPLANTEILGMLYVRKYIDSVGADKEKWKDDFDNLAKYTEINKLIKFPKDIPTEDIENYFLFQKRKSVIERFRKFAYRFYITKSEEYIQIGKEKIEREKKLVDFLYETNEELGEIETSTGLSFGDFSDSVRTAFAKWNDDEKEKLPSFNDVFNDLFENAFNSLKLEYKSLDEISLIESCLEKFSIKYPEKSNYNSNNRTLSDFLKDDEEMDEDFKKIKMVFTDETIKKINEINYKKFKLLVHGTRRYKEYIRNQSLNSREIVAILDGKHAFADLLFTTAGIKVHVPKSTRNAIGLGSALGIAAYGPIWIGVAATANIAISRLSDNIVSYPEATSQTMKNLYNQYDKKLTPCLEELIDELKKITMASSLGKIDDALNKSVKKIDKMYENLAKIKVKIIQIINEFEKKKFKENHLEEHRTKLLECLENYLSNHDISHLESELLEIKRDKTNVLIADFIDDLLALII